MPNISQPFAPCYDPFLLPKLINFLVVSRSLSAPLAELIIDMAFSVRSIHHLAKPSAHGTQYESACASNSPSLESQLIEISGTGSARKHRQNCLCWRENSCLHDFATFRPYIKLRRASSAFNFPYSAFDVPARE